MTRSARRPPEDAGTAPILDPEVLLDMVAGDAETLREVVASYQQSLPGHLARLTQALGASDRTAVERSAHSLKGGAANLGAERLRVVAAEVEEAACRGALDTCGARLPSLEAELAALLEALAADPWATAG